MAQSAVLLTMRRLLLTAVGALTAAVIARLLGPSKYGPFVSAMTIFSFALAFVDFGFSLHLAREMARAPESRERLLAATLQVQSMWSVGAALAVVVVALTAGGSRRDVLLVLSPAVAVSGLGAYRQIYYVTYRIRSLTWIDVPLGLLQYALMIIVATLGLGVTVIAGAFAVGTMTNTLWVSAAGHRLMKPSGADRRLRRKLMRSSAGMGISSLMATFYFGLDLVVLGWLVSDAQLGEYGVATKVLSILVMIPGLVMSAAFPGLSVEADEPGSLGRLTARVWHWLLVAGLPVAVGIAMFARPTVIVVFGNSYVGASGSLRVLAVAAALALLSNLTGMVMMSKKLVRPQLIQNSVAIAVNLGGNLTLVPRFGIIAAAWLTVAAEVIVVVGGLVALRGRLDFRPICRVTARPGIVIALSALAGEFATLQSTVLGIATYCVCLVVGAVLFDAWPVELKPPSPRTRRPQA